MRLSGLIWLLWAVVAVCRPAHTQEPPRAVSELQQAVDSAACWSEDEVRDENAGESLNEQGAVIDTTTADVSLLSGCMYHVVISSQSGRGKYEEFIGRYERGKRPVTVKYLYVSGEVPDGCEGEKAADCITTPDGGLLPPSAALSPQPEAAAAPASNATTTLNVTPSQPPATPSLPPSDSPRPEGTEQAGSRWSDFLIGGVLVAVAVLLFRATRPREGRPAWRRAAAGVLGALSAFLALGAFVGPTGDPTGGSDTDESSAAGGPSHEGVFVTSTVVAPGKSVQFDTLVVDRERFRYRSVLVSVGDGSVMVWTECSGGLIRSGDAFTAASPSRCRAGAFGGSPLDEPAQPIMSFDRAGRRWTFKSDRRDPKAVILRAATAEVTRQPKAERTEQVASTPAIQRPDVVADPATSALVGRYRLLDVDPSSRSRIAFLPNGFGVLQMDAIPGVVRFRWAATGDGTRARLWVDMVDAPEHIAALGAPGSECGSATVSSGQLQFRCGMTVGIAVRER